MPEPSGGGSGDPIVAGTPNAYEATFGPAYPVVGPDAEFARIEDATISGDGRTLTVSFIGGRAYVRGDFCSTDYRPWVGARNDTLDVAVVRIQHPEDGPIPPDVGCDAVGHGYTYHLILPAPFGGSTIHDLAGGTLWVREPRRLAQPGPLPSGWVLRWSGDEPGAEPPLYVRVYGPAAADIVGPNRGAGQLDLYQAFGAATVIGGGSERQEVMVGAVPAVMIRDPELGELLLQWMVGSDGVALVANEADLTIDQVLMIARGIHPG